MVVAVLAAVVQADRMNKYCSLAEHLKVRLDFIPPARISTTNNEKLTFYCVEFAISSIYRQTMNVTGT